MKSTRTIIIILIAIHLIIVHEDYLLADINDPKQIVQVSADDFSVKSDENIIVNATYNVSDGKKVTGIGIQIHFNSNYLKYIESDSHYYQDGYQGSVPKDDEKNEDGDPLTDRVIAMAWSNLGGNTWPYKELPIELFGIAFKVQNVSGPTSTWINVTDTSTPGDYSFNGKNLLLFINTMPNLDINKDGVFNLKDVLQTIRHFGNLHNISK
jgi:hypothetical protein